MINIGKNVTSMTALGEDIFVIVGINVVLLKEEFCFCFVEKYIHFVLRSFSSCYAPLLLVVTITDGVVVTDAKVNDRRPISNEARTSLLRRQFTIAWAYRRPQSSLRALRVSIDFQYRSKI